MSEVKKITYYLTISNEEYEWCKWYYSFLQGLSEHDTEVASPWTEMCDLPQESP